MDTATLTVLTVMFIALAFGLGLAIEQYLEKKKKKAH